MHHGKQGNLSDDSVKAAQERIERLRSFKRRMSDRCGASHQDETKARAEAFIAAFDGALDDNLNVSSALAALHDFMTDVNRLDPGAEGAKAALEAIDHADRALGLLPTEDAPSSEVCSEDIEEHIRLRNQARKDRRFADADRIRDDL
jgi:cysteinyl-tRNA synthetase